MSVFIKSLRTSTFNHLSIVDIQLQIMNCGPDDFKNCEIAL